MQIVAQTAAFETREYRCMGEGRQAYWLPLTRSGEDPPLPPSPYLVCQHPPERLFVRGRPDAFELMRWMPDFGFAVVGTRKPQVRSLQLVRARLQALEGTRLIIVSGLALGIDAAAHEAALVSRLPTVAILGGSLDDLYPTENRALADRILRQGGLLMTEFAPGRRIERHFFLMRNRLIAGWSKATWIVEAGFRSGALNTASWAWGQNRDTYATPCFPGDPAHAGNLGLICKEKAYPFWEPKNLKQTWNEFKNLGSRQRINPLPSLWDSELYNDEAPVSDAQHLTKEVRRATLSQGGASVEFLLDWALGAKWNPQRFFDALQLCLNEQRIEDQDGILCSSGGSAGPR